MTPSANSPTERPDHGPAHSPPAPDYYHALFHRMEQAFCVLELLFDETGQTVVDCIYRQVNPVFSQQSGLSGDVLGRSGLEVMPDLERFWFDIYGRVALTGASERLEQYVPPVGRWFDVHTFRVGGPGSREVGVLFHDITARKQQELQQAFLLRFSDALRAETSAPSVANQALRMLCAQLQLDRCYIGLYDLAGDRGIFPYQVGNHRIPPLPAEVRLSDFPAAMRVAHDQTLRIDDLAQTVGLSDTDRQNLGALGLRALVAATLRRGGDGPQWAIIALSADVRHWTPGEVALLEEATERTWAAMERARADEAMQRLTQELRTSNEQLTRTNVDLDNFIYTASHDLRVPIVNIEGLLLALTRELPPAGRVGSVPSILQFMQESVDRFKRTIGYLTDVSQLQQAHAQPPTQVPLAAVVAEVRLDLLPLVEQTQARLDLDVPAEVHVPFSEKNLRSVVYNLLSNALKYRHPERAPHVQLSYQLQDQFHVLRVQDNGLGFDVATSEAKLFGLFKRLHTHIEGTGIGLYMVKKMVENSGGRIHVASQPGEGTTFTVSLPL